MNKDKIKLEEFEQEFMSEIHALKSVSFAPVRAKEFSFPSYSYFYTKALSVAFAIPAVVAVLALFVFPENTKNGKDLAMIEASNNRLIEEIDTLDQ